MSGMDVMIVLLLLISLIGALILHRLGAILKELRWVERSLDQSLELAIQGRSRQSNVSKRSVGSPMIERAKQVGPRHEGNIGARQVRGLRFERKGGDN